MKKLADVNFFQGERKERFITQNFESNYDGFYLQELMLHALLSRLELHTWVWLFLLNVLSRTHSLSITHVPV